LKTWILIADAAHARVLEADGIGRPLSRVPDFVLDSPTPVGRDLTRERRPRVHDSTGDARHAIEPSSEPRREVKRAFALTVAEKLEAAISSGAFERLVIAAPPAMLGDLRAVLSKAVTNRIVAELPRDLVKVHDGDMRSHFAEVYLF
jgi:protein required for attachment to host cells